MKPIRKRYMNPEIECEHCEDEGCDNCQEAIVIDNEDFPENVDEELDASMKEMLGNNMKFNIIFTVGQPNLYGNPYDEEYEDEEDDEEEEYSDEEEEEEEEEIAQKTIDNCTEEEFMELARETEKEMKENGTYYSTKYQKGDNVLLKLKNWKEFKKGVVTKVHCNKRKRLVKYDIKLNNKYKGKRLYENISSNKMKSQKDYEDEEVMNELKTLIKMLNFYGMP